MYGLHTFNLYFANFVLANLYRSVFPEAIAGGAGIYIGVITLSLWNLYCCFPWMRVYDKSKSNLIGCPMIFTKRIALGIESVQIDYCLQLY